MPSLELLAPFILATAVFACIPGPGMFYAAAQTVARGSRAGWLSALGLHLAGYVHIAAAAFGLAILLETVPVLYICVKLGGAAYLIWLGLRLLMVPQPATGPAPVAATSYRHAVRDSFAVEMLNPKTAVFYLSFLPQFTDISASLPVWGQVLVLGVVVNLLFSATDVVCVLLSARTRRWFARWSPTHRWMRRASGGVLIALGVNLAASQK
jgi:threonine/homoserine/homoserine lactone efflux protein